MALHTNRKQTVVMLAMISNNLDASGTRKFASRPIRNIPQEKRRLCVGIPFLDT